MKNDLFLKMYKKTREVLSNPPYTLEDWEIFEDVVSKNYEEFHLSFKVDGDECQTFLLQSTNSKNEVYISLCIESVDIDEKTSWSIYSDMLSGEFEDFLTIYEEDIDNIMDEITRFLEVIKFCDVGKRTISLFNFYKELKEIYSEKELSVLGRILSDNGYI